MRRSGYIGKTVSVKIRAADFTTITRSYTLNRMTDRWDVIFEHALRLVPREFGMKIKVRLLGVRMSHLHKIAGGIEDDDDLTVMMGDRGQMEMIEDTVAAHVDRLTRAVDSIRDKYGEHSIRLAGTMRSQAAGRSSL